MWRGERRPHCTLHSTELLTQELLAPNAHTGAQERHERHRASP